MKPLIGLVVTMGLFFGCNGNSKSSTETTKATQAMDEAVFDSATGAVKKETDIKAGKTGVVMSIPEGTVLQDIDGNPITKAPTATVKTEKDTKEAKTTIDFTVDGKRVIPTEPVVISIPAPKGAKPGDTVQIEVPDDGSISEKSLESKIQQKLVFFIINANGTIDIRVFPNAFKNQIVLVVIIKTDNSTN